MTSASTGRDLPIVALDVHDPRAAAELLTCSTRRIASRPS